MERVCRAIARGALAIAVLAALATACGCLILCALDADEIAHAHTVWAISAHQVPFRDFFECHLPLPWYWHVPLFWILPSAAESMYGLRVFSVLGMVAWVYSVFAAQIEERPQFTKPWIAIAVLSAAVSTLNVYYTIEFRVDKWANALLFAVVLIYLRAAGQRRSWRFLVLGAGCTIAVLAVPKLYIFPPLFTVSELIRLYFRREDWLRALLDTIGGVVLGTALTLAFLYLVGIDPGLTFASSIRYHVLFLARVRYHGSLFRTFMGQTWAVGFVACGLLAAVVWHVRKRVIPGSFELASLLMIVHQLATVAVPYKQYSAPCFLMLAIFIPYLGLVLQDRPVVEAVARCAVSVMIIVRSGLVFEQARATSHFPVNVTEMNRLLSLSAPDDRVLVPPPYHPVFRRDAAYAWLNSLDPGGYMTDRAMADLEDPRLTPLFTLDHMVEELNANHPKLLMLTGYPWQNKTVAEAIERYVGEHRAEFTEERRGRNILFIRTAQR